MALAAKKKRIRRTPEDAQAHILDAAEALMAKGGGPAALRLQDVARQAGVSHPAILHHFGSRDGLMRALNKRGFSRLTDSAIAMLSAPKASDDGVKTTFAAYRDGLAQRLVWLMQSPNPPPSERLDLFERVVAAFHEARKRFAEPGAEPDIADTRAVIHLTTIAALGDALLGARLRNAGNKEAAERDAFERWFSELLDMYLRAKATQSKK
jgi:TetR/AcrR family transcriptional regulator, repressor for neighboring sulfatase